MDSRDIVTIKRRLAALERELQELKVTVAAFEAEPDAVAPSAPEPAPVSAPEPRLEPMVATALPLEHMPAGEVPPVIGTPPSMSPPVFFPEAEIPAEPAAPPRNLLREWLAPLQLWPPTGEENAEVRLAAWWATRIGALLAVIGVVFLGIYVSRNAPPWVRLAEVMAATAAVLGAGTWLERKLPKFGTVVFGAGLALAYFCAFAAYGVPAMKVIASPAVATGCEVLVVAAILVVAWRRNSPVAATMAVLLGHVTAFLALRAGPVGFGPWVVLLLGSAAVMLRLARAWEAPSVVALPLAWCFLAAATFSRTPGIELTAGAAWGWTILYFVLFTLRDWSVAWRGGALTTVDRTVQVANSTLAVAVGLLIAGRSGGSLLTEFYFGSGVLLLGAACAWRRANVETLVPIFVCKAAGLIALGVIAKFDGQARSLVLLAQAFVMLVSARQSHVRGLRTATILGGLVALAFYLGEMRPAGAALLAGATLAEVAFLAGAIAFVAALARWLALDATSAIVGSVIVAGVAVWTAALWATQGWAPAIDLALAFLLAAAASVLRGWTPAAIVAAMLVMAAHVAMWNFPQHTWGLARLWGNELALLAASALAITLLHRRPDDNHAERALRGAIVFGIAATLAVVCFKGFQPAPALASTAAVALLLGGIAARVPRWPVAALSAPVLAFGWLLYLSHGGLGNSAWLWVAVAAAWAAPLWLTVSRAAIESICDARWREWTPTAQTAVATGITLLVIGENLGGVAQLLATMTAAFAVFGFTWKPGLRPALEASWVLWGAAVLGAVRVDAKLAGWIAAGAAWAPAWMLANVAALASAKSPPPPWRSWAEGVQATLATLVGLAVAAHHLEAEKLLAFTAVSGLAFAAWKWGRVNSARRAVVAVVAVTWLAALSFVSHRHAEGWGSDLATVIGVAVLLVALPFAIDAGLAPATRSALRWTASAAGLALVMVAFVGQRGELAPYATVACGVAAMATFLAGLLARSRPHRLCGLAGIALCIPRAFAVDLNSTLHRIAAFVALGLVLLWVGFSYHRFRHLIVDDEKKL